MTRAFGTRRNRLTAPVAALLLLVEGLTGGTAALAHARELVVAPAAIEAEHGRACVVQHDPARCSTCGTAGLATLPAPDRGAPAADADLRRVSLPARPVPVTPVLSRAAPPRGPPTIPV